MLLETDCTRSCNRNRIFWGKICGLRAVHASSAFFLQAGHFPLFGSLDDSLVKIFQENYAGGNARADWIAVHASSATAIATAKFAVRAAYWSNLRDGGIQTAYFLRLRDRVHWNPPTKCGCGRNAASPAVSLIMTEGQHRPKAGKKAGLFFSWFLLITIN